MAVTKEPFQTGSWAEQAWGFAQAVKVGDTIYVSGQTAFMDDGSIDGVGDMAVQMTRAYAGIAGVLESFGATMANVVEETLFVTDMMAAATVGHDVRDQAYGGRFDLASTLVQVQALGAPELMVEIKCLARV